MLNVEEEREADIVAVGGVELPVMGENLMKEGERDYKRRGG